MRLAFAWSVGPFNRTGTRQSPSQAAIPGASASRYFRVPAFARFEATLSRLEKASALTLPIPTCSYPASNGLAEHKGSILPS
jgi:hypothetical protein